MADNLDQSTGAHPRVRARIIWYCAVALAWAVVWLLVANASWVGFEELHTLFEAAASVVALLISAMAFTRYYSRPESKFLWLATAFLGVGILDGFHSALTTWLLASYIPDELASTVEWSGYSPHLYFAVLLFLSCLGRGENQPFGGNQRSHALVVYSCSALLLVVGFAFFSFVPLPNLYQSDSIVPRPANLLPAVLFAAALYGYLRKGEWRSPDRHFDHWVIMALICMVAGQGAFLALSGTPLDPFFDIGHLTKLAAYTFILFGLLNSMRGAYEEAEANDRLLRDAVQAVGEGFALYDDEDRLVVFNEAYRRLHPATRDFIRVGMKFEDFVRATVESQTIDESLEDSEAYIARRMEQHRNPTAPIVREHNQGPSYIIHESKTAGGWSVVVETEITDLKRIESELEEKSKLLESTFNAMADGLSVWNSDNQLLAFNHKFESLMGREGDRPQVGMNIRDLFILNARAGHYGEGDAVDLGTKRYENAMRMPPDTSQHISFSGQGTFEVIRNHMEDGSRVTIHRDISDLVEAEQRLSLVIENLSEIFVLWDAEDRLVTTNRRFRELSAPIMDICVPGLPFEEFLRTGVARGMFPDAMGDVDAWVESRIQEHRKPSGPREVARQDGQWVLIQEQKLPDGGVVSVGSDITELKRVQAQFEDREQRLSAVVENVVDGIITFDRHGSILTANSAAARIFGCDVEEFLGRQLGELLTASSEGVSADDRIASLMTGEKGEIREMEGCRWDGSVFPIELAVTAVETEQEDFFVCIVRDISERREMDRMKSEFVSTVSHELRTPLTSIRGSLGLIAAGAVGELSDKASELVQIAERNARRLIGLVNDILDMEKIESGSMDYQFAESPLSEVALYALTDNQGYADEYNVSYELIDNSQGATALLDRERIAQVMANLLSNAAKFSPTGGVVVVRLDVDGLNVRISVEDTGPGIPLEFQSQVFEKFTQADASDTRKVGGTGLGLSISKSIVERHGGAINFSSIPGEGTQFYFDLPYQTLAEAPTAELPEPDATGPEASDRPAILICEDDGDVARLISLLLEQHGYQTDIAYTAEDAERMALTGRYNAMTVDLMLPDEDGISLVRQLRTHPELAALPIVVVSAIAEETQGTVDTGCIEVVDWLDKPIDETQLLSALQTAVRRTKARPIRILHVEDDIDLVHILKNLLPGDIELRNARTLREAEAALVDGSYDLVILDVLLPDGSGLSLLPLLRSYGHAATPILLFSGDYIERSITEEVAGALVKSRTSNDELLTVIGALLEREITSDQMREKQ